jgi:hypothetical protein
MYTTGVSIMPRLWLAAVSAAALGLCAGSPAYAQSKATIDFVPATSHPPLPAGLQLACIREAGSGAPSSDTCPVVKYQGITTWAFSYADNRVSFALVSYDERGQVVRNVEKPGARYLFDAMSNEPSQTVMFVGQARRNVLVPWSELGAAK